MDHYKSYVQSIYKLTVPINFTTEVSPDTVINTDLEWLRWSEGYGQLSSVSSSCRLRATRFFFLPLTGFWLVGLFEGVFVPSGNNSLRLFFYNIINLGWNIDISPIIFIINSYHTKAHKLTYQPTYPELWYVREQTSVFATTNNVNTNYYNIRGIDRPCLYWCWLQSFCSHAHHW